MWKSIYDCVAGTSHENNTLPCQDSCRVLLFPSEGEDILIACCADGAGSAAYSDIGAQTASDVFVQLLTAANGGHLASHAIFSDDGIMALCSEVRAKVIEKAAEINVDKRQLACTFLAAVVGESKATFIQIGDGAIVTWNGTAYETVFWPQSGEYANTTNFLTDDLYEDHLTWAVHEDRVDELAMFTDGLERLALRFADQMVHEPFLAPLLAALRQTENPDALFEPLRLFLGSQQVNDRTDDDKTLILATRMCDDVH